MSALDDRVEKLSHEIMRPLSELMTICTGQSIQLATLRAERDDFERKGLLLCNQNGDLLMQNSALRARLSKAEELLRGVSLTRVDNENILSCGWLAEVYTWLKEAE